MTRLLASVKSVAGAQQAVSLGADIIDISQAPAGEGGKILAVLAGGKAICAAADAKGVEYVVGNAVPGKCIGIVPAGAKDSAEQIARFSSAGSRGAMLRTERDVPLFSVATPASVEAFVAACREARLEAWIGGNLEPPDVPRLLGYDPDVLWIDGPGSEEFRALVPKHDESGTMAALPAASGKGDLILVRDFVLPVEVGAYGFEHDKPQRVCFNVEVEVRRRSEMPHDMRDIFSYDIVLDAIRGLVASGHTVLVETLAEKTAQRILRHDEVIAVKVRVEKLDLGPGAVGVEIERRKNAELKVAPN